MYINNSNNNNGNNKFWLKIIVYQKHVNDDDDDNDYHDNNNGCGGGDDDDNDDYYFILTFRGESPSEADLNLLDTARKMELYGIRMNTAKVHLKNKTIWGIMVWKYLY